MPAPKLLLVFLIGSVHLFAATSSQERLAEVNAQWLNNPDELQRVHQDFSRFSDNQMIQQHLLLVHDILASRSTAGLSAVQRQNRSESLQHLHEYAQRGIFPQNITHPGRRPVFIDHRGVHCAVGYLIKRSGHPGLSRHISESMNYHYLKDMEDNWLSEWVAQSGFSVDELAWIQPGYPKAVNWDGMKGGVNGPVYTIASDGMAGVYVGGDFDTAGTGRSPFLTQWYSGFAGFDWGFFSPAPNGPVHTILPHNNKYYVGGSFYAVDTVAAGAGVAVWDGNQWTGLGDFYVGALVNYVNDLAFYRDTLYAAGFFKSKAGTSPMFTNLAKWNGNEWVKATPDTNLPEFIYGEIKALEVYNGKLYVGGSFTLNDSAQTRNIFALNGNTFEWLDEDLPYPVFDLAVYQNELYSAARYYDSLVGDTAGLCVYRNGKWKSLIDFVNNNNPTIYTLQPTPDALVFGGDFWIDNFTQNSQNLAAYNNGNVTGLGVLNDAVRSLYYQNDQLYVGGDFTSGFNAGYVPLGHITNINLPDYVGINEKPTRHVALFPNPASAKSILELPSGEEVQSLELYDVSGRQCKPDFVQNGNQLHLNLSDLGDGVYLVRLESEAEVYTARLVVKN